MTYLELLELSRTLLAENAALRVQLQTAVLDERKECCKTIEMYCGISSDAMLLIAAIQRRGEQQNIQGRKDHVADT